ncbi:hypothetical protein GCM10023093_03150 [Nemorincola caseinilytica]|uniref:Lipoprotein n=1 Tax=Nemorincola caseinilytica TaxID=2054315 RepID=A0ABP8N4W0_9BACT
MTDKARNILVTTIVLLVSLYSCTQERQPCLTPRSASLRMRMVRKVTDSLTIDTATPNPFFRAVAAGGQQGYLYTSRSSFALSLSPVADTSMWLYSPDTAAGTLTDTIIFRYERQLQFISNACGYTYYYDLRSAATTSHTIDSVQIINSSVTSDASKNHIQVYIHPRP